ncbi:MAG: class I SAM-dependent methyltransferase [Actinomycetota bacterium]
MPQPMAAFYDRFMARTEEAGLRAWRRDLLADLTGQVVEVGAGTGANLGLYPPSVDRVLLTEPDPAMRSRLTRKAALTGGHATLEVVDAPAHRLPPEDDTIDAVVVTLVLCSVRDPRRALAEFARVLRPGGRLVYLEHVDAYDEPKRQKWQRRVEPVWKRVAGNCHLTRRTESAILDAGFETIEERREDMRSSLPLTARTVRGTARLPTTRQP